MCAALLPYLTINCICDHWANLERNNAGFTITHTMSTSTSASSDWTPTEAIDFSSSLKGMQGCVEVFILQGTDTVNMFAKVSILVLVAQGIALIHVSA